MTAQRPTPGTVGVFREWELETTIDGHLAAAWLTHNFNMCLGCGLFYVAAVFAGRTYMNNQTKYNLRQPMMVWSLLLAIFSIFGAFRTCIVTYHVINEEGIRGFVCSPKYYVGPIARFWGPVFVISKVLEYGDTAFIILRKQKLMFLHWYHHITVSLFSWLTVASHEPAGGVFMTLNFVIHSLMYSYYALRAAGIKVPRPVAVLITVSQIVQMVIGCIAVFYANVWRFDADCQSSPQHIFYGTIVYGSYLLLFLRFFYATYIKKPPSQPQRTAEDTASKTIKKEE